MAVVRRTRAVSTRDASRRLSQLLDEIDREECAILIVRYGRPAAMLVPFEESGEALKLPRITELALNEGPMESIDDDDEDIELDEDQRHVLLDIARWTGSRWSMNRCYLDPSRASALLVAVSGLEIERLLEREFGGAVLTRKGRRLAARLDSTG